MAALSAENGALVVPSGSLLAVCRALKDTDRYRMDFLSNLAAVDYPPQQIEVVYHLYSMAHKHGPIALKVKLPRENPVAASLVPVWRSAEFQEREAYDLYGVKFEGDPDLRRILMWDEFEGYPMRKDYKHEDQDASDEPAAGAAHA
jgi:NADH/F420H2 dehydrogenase subunit C